MCAGFQRLHCVNFDSWQYLIYAAEEGKETDIIQQHHTMKHFQGTNKLAIGKVKITLNHCPCTTK